MRPRDILTTPEWQLRMAFFAFILVGVAQVGSAYLTDSTRDAQMTYQEQADAPFSDREQLVGKREHATVVTGKNGMYAFSPDGRLRYYNESLRFYDVDPAPGEWRVLVAAHGAADDCTADSRCTWNYLYTANLSTGHFNTKLARKVPGVRASNWHDVDAVGDSTYLVASMREDLVYRINTTTGIIDFEWRVESAFGYGSGGPYPTDFAHLNDVERLADGRLMVSLRNQDSVVFIHPERGLQENWTLGCPDCFDVLYEQHQPDYIPASRGGPAVLVADSENNRVVEYQRVNGSWVQSWVYQPKGMNWPRDADRLPNGHTLITDTHNHRVIEVDRDGDVVWSADVPFGYDAERLGTGDESAGGPSAVRANLTSVGGDTLANRTSLTIANEGEWTTIKKWKHGIQFVIPTWMGIYELGVGILVGVVALLWAAIEARLRGWALQSPIYHE